MMGVITATTQFFVEDCCNCGMQFAVTADFNRRRREDHKRFFCPDGHGQSYNSESETEKLRRERDRLAQRIAEKDDEITRQRDMRERTEKRLSATKGVVTRIKNRVGNGVCPCCTRTFGNLAKHMQTQHPTYKAEAAE